MAKDGMTLWSFCAWSAATATGCRRWISGNHEFLAGVKDQGLSLMSDNGSQPTSLAFMKACRGMAIKQAFTSYNNPKGNADTKRAFRTLKEELL